MDEYLAKKEVEEKTRLEILDMEGSSSSHDDAHASMLSKLELNKYKALPPIGETTAKDAVNREECK